MTITRPESGVATPASQPLEPNRSPSRLRNVARGLRSRPSGMVALIYLAVLFFLSVFGPLITPHDPTLQELSNNFAGPSAEHWLGTDQFGRDVLSRMIDASRIVLLAPFIALATASLLGVPIALLAGMRRGIVDATVGRIADAVMSLPAIVLAMVIVAVLGPGLMNSMIAVGIAFAPTLFRVVRGAALSTARETFMDSSKSTGCSVPRLMFVHLFPNVAAPLLVQVTFLMGITLLAEASLSFIGLGVQPPDASWGSMLSAAYQNQYQDPWGAVAPGIALALTVLAFNVLGDTMRDVLAKGRRS